MGYFRIFYYITYILNFLLRLIKRHGKAVLWFICIAVFLVICLYNPKSQAVYTGNYDYADPNYAILNSYESICIDFLQRFENVSNKDSQTWRNLKNSITVLMRDIYLYYVPGTSAANPGANDFGLSMINGAPLNTNRLYILFIPKNNYPFSVSPSVYDTYLGIDCDIKNLVSQTNNSVYLYYIDYGSNSQLVSVDISLNDTFYVPSVLLHYYSDSIYNYFFNNYSLQEIEILHDMNNKLNQANQELQSQTDYMTEEPSSEDFSTSDLPTDSGVTATTDSGLNNIFSSLYNVFTGQPNNQHNIIINVPFTR